MYIFLRFKVPVIFWKVYISNFKRVFFCTMSLYQQKKKNTRNEPPESFLMEDWFRLENNFLEHSVPVVS